MVRAQSLTQMIFFILPLHASSFQTLPAGGRLEPIDSQKAEDILPKILPPIVFEKDGQLWLQKVSATPATRLDVQRLFTVSINN